MGWLILLVVVIALLAIMAAKLKSQGQNSQSYPYKMRQVLFSPAERSFLGVLDQAVGESYRVFGKVRVADVVSVHPTPDRKVWQRAFNKISSKHLDFVLCSKSDLTVVAAIELDDSSHQKRKRQKRDAFLVGVCQAAGIPLVQVPAQRTYSVAGLRAQVLSALGLPQDMAPSSTDGAEMTQKVAPGRPESGSGVVESVEPHQPSARLDVPRCPKCSAPMVRRETKGGANAGKEFWGCSTFPKCRSMLPVSA